MTAVEAGVVGAGRVGQSLAAALAESDRYGTVWTAGRRVEEPAFLRDRPEVAYGVLDRWARELPTHGSERLHLFFCVPDRALGDAARSWAAALDGAGLLPDGPGEAQGPVLRAAFHTSGSRPASALSPLSEAGGGRGPGLASLHPLCAVPAPDPEAFRGVTFGVEGESDAVEEASELARRIGRRAVRVDPGEKGRYHAGAVLASNLLVACFGAGLRQLRDATAGGASAADLLPLARSALAGVERRGPADGLTGPVVRGDLETVARHLEALDPCARSLYACLTSELLRQADLEPSLRRAAEELLGETEAAGSTAE